MGYIGGKSGNQRYLLPERIDEDVGEDNPMQFVDTFVQKRFHRSEPWRRALGNGQ
jgi:hypothetical protein